VSRSVGRGHVNEHLQAKQWDGPGLDAWSPWLPGEVASKLANVEVRWSVVGGYAIDLWLGATTRKHEDIEIAIPRSAFQNIRECLSDFDLHSVGDGEVIKLSTGQAPEDGKHQCWILDRSENASRGSLVGFRQIPVCG
jgi:hypothetical protein